MNYWKKIVLSAFIVLLAFPAIYGGISDTIMLDKVIAKGVKFSGHTTGAKFYTVDTLTLKIFQSSSLAELLQQQSLVAVKMLGLGGLATVSLRGGSSRHTAIIWNGFNLRSPMNGGLNFSALPAGFIDEVSIQPGGSSTMYGSGAASGIIFLNNNLPMNGSGWKTMINTEVASFGTYNGAIAVGFLGEKFSTQLRLGYQLAENDFTFINEDEFNDPTVTLEHAAFDRKSFLYQTALKIGSHGLLETDLLYTDYFKEIPAMTFDNGESQAVQQDKNLRFALNYSNIRDRWFFRYRSGILYDNIYYSDPAYPPIKTSNISRSFINEAEAKYSFNLVHTLFFGINQTFEQASSQGYISDTSRMRCSVFGRYNLSLFQERFAFSIETRQEMVELKTSPFVFSLGSKYQLLPILNLKGVLARHYAIPIFDDIFWKEDGFARGNPKLGPEYGWNYELGIEHSIDRKPLSLHNEFTVFFNHTYDLIIWMRPDEDDSKWEPLNVDESKSRGIEYMGDMKINLPKSVIEIRSMYSYTNALIFDDNKASGKGQPRIYVPKHNASISVGYSLRGLSLRYTQTYTGKCLYDDSHTLDSYSLGNIQVGYNLTCNALCIDIYLRVRNVFSTSYQLMAGYAQPPRNIAIGINFKF